MKKLNEKATTETKEIEKELDEERRNSNELQVLCLNVYAHLICYKLYHKR